MENSNDKKKILIIIGVLILLIAIGVGVYFFTRPQKTGDSAEPTKGNFLSFLFPSSDKRTDGVTPAPEDGNGQNQPGQPDAQPSKKLLQITENAVAGAAFYEKSKKVRYFEKSTGYLYEITPQGQEKEQKSITTMPKIFEVAWSKDASKAVLLLLDQNSGKSAIVRTFLAYSMATSSQEITGTFLPLNTGAIAVSPSEDKIFYLLTENGSGVGFSASFENKTQTQIFSLPFSEFIVNWPKDDTITLLTKPAAGIDGYLYKLNPKTKAFSKMLGPIKGLIAQISLDGKKILYSKDSDDGSLIVILYDSETQINSIFSYRTLPEKCFFSRNTKTVIYCAAPIELPAAAYPDDWYKGIISFNDSLWRIDLETGTTDALLENSGLDMVNLFTDTYENYIFFQNKKDGTLWSLKLSE